MVAKWFTNAPKRIAEVSEYVRPIVEDKQKKIDEYGKDYPDKEVRVDYLIDRHIPILCYEKQTFLTWMLDEAKGDERTLPRLTNRVLSLNFAAIHTSSMVGDEGSSGNGYGINSLQSFTQALYELAARPEYLAPLREEVENVVERYGWTKMALVHMNKLDSFFKESQRMNSGASML